MTRNTLLLAALTAAAFVAAASFHSTSRADDDTSGIAALVDLLGLVDEAEVQLDLLKGMHDGLKGRKAVRMPESWPGVYGRLAKSENAEVRELALMLALIFGDPQAIDALRSTLADKQADAQERRRAIEALVDARLPEFAPTLQGLVSDPAVRGAAIRSLAAYQDARTPEIVLRDYKRYTDDEKQDAVATLASRPAYAFALLDGIAAGTVERNDVTVFIARQVNNMGNEQLSARLAEVWGAVRDTSQDKQALIRKFKALLTPEALAKADLSHGRVIYNKSCAKCHVLYGEGGKIGPDLTGSNRANLDYVLENALDPSAVIGRDYRLTNVLTLDGRLISGIIYEQTDSAITMQTVNERVVVSRDDIDEMSPSPISMMPEGQFEQMQPQEVIDLVAYLASKTQVPLK